MLSRGITNNDWTWQNTGNIKISDCNAQYHCQHHRYVYLVPGFGRAFFLDVNMAKGQALSASAMHYS